MVTGVIKNKIDKIWTDIWAGGITNPLTVIEQLTYLMFISGGPHRHTENGRRPQYLRFLRDGTRHSHLCL